MFTGLPFEYYARIFDIPIYILQSIDLQKVECGVPIEI
jgi:hypothetical protein